MLEKCQVGKRLTFWTCHNCCTYAPCGLLRMGQFRDRYGLKGGRLMTARAAGGAELSERTSLLFPSADDSASEGLMCHSLLSWRHCRGWHRPGKSHLPVCRVCAEGWRCCNPFLMSAVVLFLFKHMLDMPVHSCSSNCECSRVMHVNVGAATCMSTLGPLFYLR